MSGDRRKRGEFVDTPASRRERVAVALGVDADVWIRDEARRRGWRLLSLQVPAGVTPRGAIVSFLPGDEELEELREMGCAAVRLGKLPHPDDAALPAVLPDQEAAGRLAAEHFAGRDFRHVAYSGQVPWGDAEPLFAGFRKRSEELQMECHLQLFETIEKEPSHKQKSRKRNDFIGWIRELPKPVGLLAPGDWRAALFSEWVREAGLRQPEDVAILSRGNRHEICECTVPTISSIDLSDEERSRAACDLLDRIMAGGAPPEGPIMVAPKGIVERESTSLIATTDDVVAAALRYMWENLDLDISVEDISRAAGLSSRQLKRRFSKALNRGINEELRRKRLEEAKRLLGSTSLPVAEVGSLVGFHSATYLHRTFRAAFGMTPAQYRLSLR